VSRTDGSRGRSTAPSDPNSFPTFSVEVPSDPRRALPGRVKGFGTAPGSPHVRREPLLSCVSPFRGNWPRGFDRMPRRGFVSKRVVSPDPCTATLLVAKMIHAIMLDGKARVAENVVYGSLDVLKGKDEGRPRRGPEKSDRERENRWSRSSPAGSGAPPTRSRSRSARNDASPSRSAGWSGTRGSGPRRP